MFPLKSAIERCTSYAVREDGEFVVLEGSEVLTGKQGMCKSYGGFRKDHHPRVAQFRTVRQTRCKTLALSISPQLLAAVRADRTATGALNGRSKDRSTTYNEWQQTLAI